VEEQVDARKQRLGPADALKLARAASQLVVAKGKSVVRIDLRKETLSDEELLKLLLGPSGKLRAPTMRRGKTLLVGFNADEFAGELAS
jgi:arsenate reductase-like glutaredoxin family protein